ncbi:MAG: HDIG domain-containing metalloprotein [Bacteroidota bacterium]
MNKLFQFIGKKQEEILRILLAITTIVIVVFMLPKDVSFRYEYELGKPWLHENLSAPFDFAINKTPDELEAERSKILQSVKSYFKFNNSIAESKINDYLNDANTKWNLMKHLPNPYQDSIEKRKQLDIGSSLLQAVYDKGVILLTDDFEKKNSSTIIMLVNDKNAEPKELKQLYTQQSAYKYIENVLDNDHHADKTFLLPLIENSLTQNIFYDDSLTKAIYKDNLDKISISNGILQKGENIISTSELVDKKKFRLLESLKDEYQSRIGYKTNSISIAFGQLIVVTLVITMLLFFLALFRKDVFNDTRKITLPLLLIVIMVGIYNWSMHTSLFNPYLIPFCIVPIIIKAFFDTRMALFLHIIILLIIGFIAPNGFEFVFIQIITGMFTIYSIVSLRKRSQLFLTSGVIFLAYLISYIGISKLHSVNYSNINWVDIGCLGANSLLALLAYPVIYIFEKLFGIISEVSLMEISDANNPLLRELSLKAPGTFQHSLQVANLAESAIAEIKGNTLLVRAGAMYHDIGKMENPRYFIENQNTNNNPHDLLTFEESAHIIIEHVTKGVEIAHKHNLPEPIINFIRTHHGTTMVQYFYQSFLKNYPDKIIDKNTFRYPGPIPFTKETAVLMMADSVEAAARSLKNNDAETIENLVDHIIDSQIEMGQFTDSDITFRDIASIKRIFKQMLISIYHARVEYPR